jgi:hypothetical protein
MVGDERAQLEQEHAASQKTVAAAVNVEASAIEDLHKEVRPPCSF